MIADGRYERNVESWPSEASGQWPLLFRLARHLLRLNTVAERDE
jgi:hypothetical protein